MPPTQGARLQPASFTFERPAWTGPWGLRFQAPWLTPVSFATAATAAAVCEVCQGALDDLSAELRRTFTARVVDVSKRIGPWQRTVERRINVLAGRLPIAGYPAGQVAGLIIRRGEREAMRHWIAEIQDAWTTPFGHGEAARVAGRIWRAAAGSERREE